MPRTAHRVTVGIVLLVLFTTRGAVHARDRQDVQDHPLAMFVLVARPPSWTFAQTPSQGSPRVRSSSPAIATAIEQLFEQSPTFRELVADINRTDGIVYVHHGQCGRNVLACLLLAVTRAGPNRILHIRVDPRRKGRDLMVSIGHELQHAVELLSEPSVVDSNPAHNFYHRAAAIDRYIFETQAAIEIELKIDKELREWAKRR